MKIRTLIIAAMLTIVAFFTTTASAKEVDHALAANPSAVLSEINGMNLPALSDQEAGKIRGEGLEIFQIVYYGWVMYGIPLSYKAATYISLNWKPGSLSGLGSALSSLGRPQTCVPGSYANSTPAYCN